ncbi:helix-turn-helix domain-containing protein [Gudongella oleilytica]|uniref:helix-turn-helix domain-containing protein n=1 Tax=Gudongella oleilytica TaxID=1582259 RepID=UPI002A36F780|nr:helix-turn-helix domain-containing protein [Gudongella oleilytica]
MFFRGEIMKDTVFYERVLKLCSEKGISVTALAEAIGKQASTASGWKKGAVPRADTLRQVADYFGVSTGYLTGDESVNVENVHTNNGIIGHAHAPVTIVNGSERLLSANEIELLHIFSELNAIEQAKVLVFANELKEKQRK